MKYSIGSKYNYLIYLLDKYINNENEAYLLYFRNSSAQIVKMNLENTPVIKNILVFEMGSSLVGMMAIAENKSK